jgi:hypothetical protein
VRRAYLYGIYDIGRNAGFVNVGTDHDTGAFAVASIRGWWRSEGRTLPEARRIARLGLRGRNDRLILEVPCAFHGELPHSYMQDASVAIPGKLRWLRHENLG